MREADFIAAEDTRVTRKLLSALNIKKPVISYRAHNKNNAGEEILSRIKTGDNCALVTDAGTPAISDPGEDLVRLCIDNDIRIAAIPGPCAAITALILSGLPAVRFVFEGFLPSARGKRISRLRELAAETRTMIFYEPPHRTYQTLSDMHSIFGDRQISVSRELTKLFEETLRFTLSEAVEHFKTVTPRGEFVIVVEGSKTAAASSQRMSIGTLNEAADIALTLINAGYSVKDAIEKAAAETGCSSNKLYNLVIKLRK